MIEWDIMPDGTLRLGEFPFVDGVFVSFVSDRAAHLLSVTAQRDDLRLRCTVHINGVARVDASFIDDDVISGLQISRVSGREPLSSFYMIYGNYSNEDREAAISRAIKQINPLYFIRITGNMGGDYCALAKGVSLESIST